MRKGKEGKKREEKKKAREIGKKNQEKFLQLN